MVKPLYCFKSIASDWVTIKWTYKKRAGRKGTMDIPVEHIDSHIENGGVALMYYKNDNYQTEAFTGFRIYFDGAPIAVNILKNEKEDTIRVFDMFWPLLQSLQQPSHQINRR